MAKNFSKEQTQEIRDIIRSTLNNYQGHIRMNGGVLKAVNSNISQQQITLTPGANIQNALNTLNANGGGILFLQSGFYPCTNNLVVGSNVTIQGEAPFNTIIDFQATGNGIVIQGSNPYTTGTVSITKNSSSLTGSGTTWTSAMNGQYVFLQGTWYQIQKVTSTTALTLVLEYSGTTLSGSGYAISTPTIGSQLLNFTVQNSTGTGIAVNYSQYIEFNNLLVQGCGTGMSTNYTATILCNNSLFLGCNYGLYFYQSYDLNFTEFQVDTTYVGSGIVINYSSQSSFINFACNSCAADGINLTNATSMTFTDFEIDYNIGNGVHLNAGCALCTFDAGDLSFNGAIGFRVTSAFNIWCTNTSVQPNGTYGIQIDNSTSQYIVLIGNIVYTQPSGYLNDSGTLTKCRGNVNITDKN